MQWPCGTGLMALALWHWHHGIVRGQWKPAMAMVGHFDSCSILICAFIDFGFPVHVCEFTMGYCLHRQASGKPPAKPVNFCSDGLSRVFERLEWSPAMLRNKHQMPEVQMPEVKVPSRLACRCQHHCQPRVTRTRTFLLVLLGTVLFW